MTKTTGGTQKRRWLHGFAVGLFFVVGAAAIGWFVWLPAYRPGLEAGEGYGIDVSHHQRRIDWSAVANDNISFAYLKSTEGGDLVDAEFARNWKNSRSAGLKVGAYHFFTLCRSGADQATNVIRTVPRESDSLPLAIDLELAGNCSKRPTDERLRVELNDFIERVERHFAQKVVLYVGPEFETKYPVKRTLRRSLWYVSFVRRPSQDDWKVWQLHGFAKVDGIDGRVDLNVGKLNLLRQN